jgi:Glycosyl transferase family 2
MRNSLEPGPLMRLNATYILPIRTHRPVSHELSLYLEWLCRYLEVIVVDGSVSEVFEIHDRDWPRAVIHCAPDGEALNGKVAGVLTGLRFASHERVILADDDVRYDEDALRRTVDLLEDYSVVRPQNYYGELPWHARLDTARTLLNRCIGGDWPGTLGVQRSAVMRSGGYDGNVLFENLELVRTVRASGGNETIPLDLYVRRLPPQTGHFLTQRVRQAYDELARPIHMLVELALLPAILLGCFRGRWRALLFACIVVVGVAETGRGRAGGRAVFPPSASLLAPLWLFERAVCIWAALACRVFLGGVPYRGKRIVRAAHSMRELRQRYALPSTSGVLP